MIGTFILLFGWMGLNTGRVAGASELAAAGIAVNTNLAAVGGETVRLIESGLPLYILGFRAEAQGQRQRATAVVVSEPPPSAPKAHPSRPRQYVMPPMAWRREWEALLQHEAEL